MAGIAAGDVVAGGPNEMGWGELAFSGVAPGAYLMAYRFDFAYTPEILQAIDDAVADKADVINNSSVSYTHLDVYKRQFQAWVLVSCSGLLYASRDGLDARNHPC